MTDDAAIDLLARTGLRLAAARSPLAPPEACEPTEALPPFAAIDPGAPFGHAPSTWEAAAILDALSTLDDRVARVETAVARLADRTDAALAKRLDGIAAAVAALPAPAREPSVTVLAALVGLAERLERIEAATAPPDIEAARVVPEPPVAAEAEAAPPDPEKKHRKPHSKRRK